MCPFLLNIHKLLFVLVFQASRQVKKYTGINFLVFVFCAFRWVYSSVALKWPKDQGAGEDAYFRICASERQTEVFILSIDKEGSQGIFCAWYFLRVEKDFDPSSAISTALLLASLSIRGGIFALLSQSSPWALFLRSSFASWAIPLSFAKSLLRALWLDSGRPSDILGHHW